MFACYRRGEANDPEGYVAAIAAVLSLYDADLIREVTDPRTGIMTREKYMSFMPNAGELKVYCDGVAAQRVYIGHLAAFPPPRLGSPPPLPAGPGDLATIFVASSHRRYESLVTWTKAADPRFWKFGKSSDGKSGLWIDLDTWETRSQ